MKGLKMKRLRGFTLAEVLITLAIIGVVAAISIPSVISNSQQQEFKTGLRKAVSVLNSAIAMNMAIDGESPYDNGDTFNYLQRHMSIMKSTISLPFHYSTIYANGSTGPVGANAGFYTTDGMRFEMEDICASGCCMGVKNFHEAKNVRYNIPTGDTTTYGSCSGCGSYGLPYNPNNTTKPPCMIMVDVNGDRKPNPSNVNCTKGECYKTNYLKLLPPDSKYLNDIFSIVITENRAFPFGVLAQKAMYQAQK